jgi:hypothetical protein
MNEPFYCPLWEIAMKRKHWLIVALVVMLILLIQVAPLLRQRKQERRITRATYELITQLMGQEDVEALLGCPPGDYTVNRSISTIVPPPQVISKVLLPGETYMIWATDEGAIVVLYNRYHMVSGKAFCPGTLPNPGVMDELFRLPRDWKHTP